MSSTQQTAAYIARPIETVQARDYVWHEGRAAYVVQAHDQPEDGSVALELEDGEYLTRDYGVSVEVFSEMPVNLLAAVLVKRASDRLGW